MLTQTELESAFKLHFDEMEKCEQHKCYWALLHLVVILPDICGALESSNGEAKPKWYKKWCDRYLSDNTISSDEWYEMRCILLHQGRTVAKRGKYHSYSFGQPTSKGTIIHRITRTAPGVQNLHLDVGKMKREVVNAMKKWFRFLEKDADPLTSKHVQLHLTSLARTGLMSKGLIHGIDIILQSTSSSPPQGGL